MVISSMPCTHEKKTDDQMIENKDWPSASTVLLNHRFIHLHMLETFIEVAT
jgi:hypothetical protein